MAGAHAKTLASMGLLPFHFERDESIGLSHQYNIGLIDVWLDSRIQINKETRAYLRGVINLLSWASTEAITKDPTQMSKLVGWGQSINAEGGLELRTGGK